MMYGYGAGWGLNFFGGFFMLIFWLAIVWLVVAFVRGSFHGCGTGGCGGHGKQKKNHASDILQERYAKGEISKEEFEEKSATLKKFENQ